MGAQAGHVQPQTQARTSTLLDTNLLSELRKGARCDAGVREWLGLANTEQLFLSVVVLGEIAQGRVT